MEVERLREGGRGRWQRIEQQVGFKSRDRRKWRRALDEARRDGLAQGGGEWAAEDSRATL